MRKLLLTALLIGAFAVHGPAQLLYRISGNGLQQPSYIIGTFHLANVGFVDKIPGVREAMTATRQVCGEVVWADMTNADTLKAVQSFMLLPDGKRLRDVLTAEQYQRVDGCLKSLLGAGLDNPQVAAQMGSMSPAALSAQLTVLQYMARHMGEFDPTSTFDQYFQAQATHAGGAAPVLRRSPDGHERHDRGHSQGFLCTGSRRDEAGHGQENGQCVRRNG